MAYVGPVEIGAIHRAKGFRGATVEACLPSPQLREGEPPLRELLAGFPRRRGTVDVLLASALVRFLVVPTDAEIASRAERQAYAELLCEREFGMPSSSFSLRLADGPLDEATLACVIDNEVLQATFMDCGGAQKVRTAVPLFIHLFNHVRRSLTTGALAVAEAGRLTVGFFVQGRWQDVASRAYTPDDTGMLTKVLYDYAPVLGEAGSCFVFDPAGRLAHMAPETWKLNVIPAGSRSFPLAACALVR